MVAIGPVTAQHSCTCQDALLEQWGQCCCGNGRPLCLELEMACSFSAGALEGTQGSLPCLMRLGAMQCHVDVMFSKGPHHHQVQMVVAAGEPVSVVIGSSGPGSWCYWICGSTQMIELWLSHDAHRGQGAGQQSVTPAVSGWAPGLTCDSQGLHGPFPCTVPSGCPDSSHVQQDTCLLWWGGVGYSELFPILVQVQEGL